MSHPLGLRVGERRTVRHRVQQRTMVRNLYPGVPEFARKPEVMATGWLVGLCEWPAMEALSRYLTERQCSLGTKVTLSHLAPVTAGTTLWSTARCVQVAGAFSEWNVTVRDEREVVGAATVGFVVVDLEEFTIRRLSRGLSDDVTLKEQVVVDAG